MWSEVDELRNKDDDRRAGHCKGFFFFKVDWHEAH